MDTTELFLEVKKAEEVLKSNLFRGAYDLFFQTKFEQEDNLLKSLELQQISKEEKLAIFFQQMQTKRKIIACVEAIPSAIAWTLTTLLLLNVSGQVLNSL